MTLLIRATIALVSFLSLIVSFNPQWHFWGLDSFRVMPGTLRIVLVGLILALNLPQISRAVSIPLHDKLNSLTRNQVRALYLVITCVAFLFFVLLSSDNHLLGDGYNLMGNIAASMKFSATEPLDYLIHNFIFSLTPGGDEGALLSYKICSYAAGLTLLVSIFIFIRNISHVLVGIALLLTFGTMQFFFGYVESYTISFVFMFLFLMSARKNLYKTKPRMISLLFLVMAIGFHLSSMVLLLSCIYLFCRKWTWRQAVIFILPVGILMLIGGFIYFPRYFSIAQVFVPVIPTQDNPYSLLSTAHLYDLINIFLLNCPLFIILPFALRYVKREKARFFILAIVPALLFTIFVDPKIGAIRDWDLLSIAAAPIMVLLLHVLILSLRTRKSETFPIFLQLAIFAILHTGTWIYTNTDRNDCYSYIKDSIRRDPHYSTDYYRGYRNKSWGFIAGKQLGDIAEAVRAWEKRFEGDPEDAKNLCALTQCYFNIGDTNKAVDFIRNNWNRFVDDGETVPVLVSFLIEVDRVREAEEIYESLIGSGESDFRVYYDLAVLKKQRGRVDSAILLFDQFFKKCPSAPVDLELGFYLSTIPQGRYKIAEEGLLRILPKLGGQEKSYVSYILSILRRRNQAEIDILVEEIKRTKRTANHLP